MQNPSNGTGRLSSGASAVAEWLPSLASELERELGGSATAVLEPPAAKAAVDQESEFIERHFRPARGQVNGATGLAVEQDDASAQAKDCIPSPPLEFLIASLIHDLRSPLAVASSAAWTLKDPDCPAEEREYWTDCVLRNLTSLQYLLEDFRDHVPDGAEYPHGAVPAQLEPLDLATVVRPIVQDYAAMVKTHVFQLRCGKAPVNGDAVQLGRLVFNLISNAARYSPSGSIVHIVVDQVQEDGQTVSLLRVADCGAGVSQQELEGLRHPWDASAGGSPLPSGATCGARRRRRGLGLSSVRRIADLHGAEVRVEVRPGQGSAFEVLFPATA